jgi:hypothetical protein
MIRLPADMARKFDDLCSQFQGLAPATVMRMLVADQLERDPRKQVEIVNRQIRKGTAKGGSGGAVVSE